MSTPINDGGPAFPHYDTGETGTRPGMSLRDYFAGLALRPEMSRHVNGGFSRAEIAKRAYELADLMLAAREVQS